MSKHKARLSRRNFLLTIGAGGAAAAATLAAKSPPTGATPTTARRGTGGYQESAHVRNYYRTTKV
jgi:hypothetical protein